MGRRRRRISSWLVAVIISCWCCWSCRFICFRSAFWVGKNNNGSCGSGQVLVSLRYCKWRTCTTPTASQLLAWMCSQARSMVAPTSIPPHLFTEWSSPRSPTSSFSPVHSYRLLRIDIIISCNGFHVGLRLVPESSASFLFPNPFYETWTGRSNLYCVQQEIIYLGSMPRMLLSLCNLHLNPQSHQTSHGLLFWGTMTRNLPSRGKGWWNT